MHQNFVDILTEFHSFRGIRVYYDDIWIHEILICRDKICETTLMMDDLYPHVRAFVDWFRQYERGIFERPDIMKMRLQSSKTFFAGAVYSALIEIPAGKMVTYGRLAELAGNAKASRAVGHLMAVNRYPVVIPCHRVFSRTNTWLYAYGEDVKRELLWHEHVEF